MHRASTSLGRVLEAKEAFRLAWLLLQQNAEYLPKGTEKAENLPPHPTLFIEEAAPHTHRLSALMWCCRTSLR